MAGPTHRDLFAPRPRGGDEGPLTVSALTHSLKGLIEGRFAQVQVVGEVSGLRRAASGHLYFTLKDAGAQLSAVAWRSQAQRFSQHLREGEEIVATGGLDLYPPRGQYQLIVRQVAPQGEGALRAAYQALKAKLHAEGLFDPARKRPLPWLPRKVGVVTSPSGAAIRDFLDVLGRRNPAVEVLIAPARVQGAGAAREIAAQLRRLDARGDCDVLVVTRGGGSLQDLWEFNDEGLARAIAACQAPVISAVGHEVDESISDYVADLRAATPSVAAEQLAPERAALAQALREREARLRQGLRHGLARRQLRLERLWGQLRDPRRLLAGHRLRLEGLEQRATAATRARLRAGATELTQLERRLQPRHPRAELRALAARLSQLEARLAAQVQRHLATARRDHARFAGALDALSPLKVLQRGYGLVRDEAGRVVRDASALRPGDALQVDLARGRVDAEVRTIYTPEREVSDAEEESPA